MYEGQVDQVRRVLARAVGGDFFVVGRLASKILASL
jgi:hypothetical protein